MAKKKLKKITEFDNSEINIPQENIIKIEDKKPEKSLKSIYEGYTDGYKIIKDGNIIYDSTKDKNNSIKFEDEYFTLFGKKYSYLGTRFINIK